MTFYPHFPFFLFQSNFYLWKKLYSERILWLKGPHRVCEKAISFEEAFIFGLSSFFKGN